MLKTCYNVNFQVIFTPYITNKQMTVYITYEFSDYGLWDMSNTKVFTTREAAEAYSDKCYEDKGLYLDVTEFEVE